MIRGAIFDADGTLLDSMGIWSGVGSGYLRAMGIEAKEDLDERFKDMSLYQSARCLKEEYDLPLSIEEIGAGINKMVDHLYADSVELKPGVEFHEALKVLGTGIDDTLLFEDALYSVKTAKAEGIKSVGIYEETMPQQDELMELSQFYIKEYRNLDDFWSYLDNI